MGKGSRGSGIDGCLVAVVTFIFKLIVTLFCIPLAFFSLFDVFRWFTIFPFFFRTKSLEVFWRKSVLSFLILFADLACLLMTVMTFFPMHRAVQMVVNIFKLAGPCLPSDEPTSASGGGGGIFGAVKKTITNYVEDQFGIDSINFAVRKHVAKIFIRYLLDIPSILGLVGACLFVWRIPVTLTRYYYLALHEMKYINYEEENDSDLHTWRYVGWFNIAFGVCDVLAAFAVVGGFIFSPYRCLTMTIPAAWASYKSDRDKVEPITDYKAKGLRHMWYEWRSICGFGFLMSFLDALCIFGMAFCVFFPWRWKSIYESCSCFAPKDGNKNDDKNNGGTVEEQRKSSTVVLETPPKDPITKRSGSLIPTLNAMKFQADWHLVGWVNVLFGFFDVMTGFFAVFVLLSPRHWLLRRDWKQVHSQSEFQYIAERRFDVYKNFGMMLLGLPCIFLLPFTLFRCRPLYRRCKIITKDSRCEEYDADGWQYCSYRKAILIEFIKVLILFLLLPLLLLVGVTFYRIPYVKEDIQKLLAQEKEKRAARARSGGNSSSTDVSGYAGSSSSGVKVMSDGEDDDEDEKGNREPQGTPANASSPSRSSDDDVPRTHADVELEDETFLKRMAIISYHAGSILADFVCLLLAVLVCFMLMRAHYLFRVLAYLPERVKASGEIASYRRQQIIMNLAWAFFDTFLVLVSVVFILSPFRLFVACNHLYRRYKVEKILISRAKDAAARRTLTVQQRIASSKNDNDGDDLGGQQEERENNATAVDVAVSPTTASPTSTTLAIKSSAASSSSFINVHQQRILELKSDVPHFEYDVYMEHGPFICLFFAGVWGRQLIETLIDFCAYLAFLFAHVIPFRASKMYQKLFSSRDHLEVRNASKTVSHFIRLYKEASGGDRHTDLLDKFRLRLYKDIGKNGKPVLNRGNIRDDCFGPAMLFFLSRVDDVVTSLEIRSDPIQLSRLQELEYRLKSDTEREEIEMEQRELRESKKEQKKQSLAAKASDKVILLTIRLLQRMCRRGEQTLKVRDAVARSGITQVFGSGGSDQVQAYQAIVAKYGRKKSVRLPRFAARKQNETALSNDSYLWSVNSDDGRNDHDDNDMANGRKPPWMSAQNDLVIDQRLDELRQRWTAACESEVGGLVRRLSNVDEILIQLVKKDNKSNQDVDADVQASFDEIADGADFNRYFNAAQILTVAPEDPDANLEVFCTAQETTLTELRDLQKELFRAEGFCCTGFGFNGPWAKMRHIIFHNALMIFPDILICIGLFILLVTVYRFYPMCKIIYRNRHWRRFVWDMVLEILVDFFFLLLWVFVMITLIYSLEMNVNLVKYIYRERSFFVCRLIIVEYVILILLGFKDILEAIVRWDIIKYILAVVICGLAVPVEFIQHQFFPPDPVTKELPTFCGRCGIPKWIVVMIFMIVLYVLSMVTALASIDPVTTIAYVFAAVLLLLLVGIFVMVCIKPIKERITARAYESDEDDEDSDINVAHLEPMMIRHAPLNTQLMLPIIQLLIEGAQLASLPIVKHRDWGDIPGLGYVRSIARWSTMAYVTASDDGRAFPVGFYLALTVVLTYFMVIGFPLVVNGIFRSTKTQPLKSKGWHNTVYILGPVLCLAVVHNLAGFSMCSEEYTFFNDFTAFNGSVFNRSNMPLPQYRENAGPNGYAPPRPTPFSTVNASTNQSSLDNAMWISDLDVRTMFYNATENFTMRFLTVGEGFSGYDSTVDTVSENDLCWSPEYRGWAFWAIVGLAFYIPTVALKTARWPTPLHGVSLRFHEHYNAIVVILHCFLGVLAGILPSQVIAYSVIQIIVLTSFVVVTWKNTSWILPVTRNCSAYVINCFRNSVHLFGVFSAIVTIIAAVSSSSDGSGDKNDGGTPAPTAANTTDTTNDGTLYTILLIAALAICTIIFFLRIIIFRDEGDFMVNDLTRFIEDILAFEERLNDKKLLVVWSQNAALRAKWQRNLKAAMTPQPLIDAILELELHIHIVAMKPIFFKTRRIWELKLRSLYDHGLMASTFQELERCFQELKQGTFIDDPSALFETLGVGLEWIEGVDEHDDGDDAFSRTHPFGRQRSLEGNDDVKPSVRTGSGDDGIAGAPPPPVVGSLMSDLEEEQRKWAEEKRQQRQRQQQKAGTGSSASGTTTTTAVNIVIPPSHRVVLNVTYVARLQKFFQIYDQSRYYEVKALLKEFHGREEELFAQLQEQYGPEPQDSTADFFTTRQDSSMETLEC